MTPEKPLSVLAIKSTSDEIKRAREGEDRRVGGEINVWVGSCVTFSMYTYQSKQRNKNMKANIKILLIIFNLASHISPTFKLKLS